MQDDAAGLCRVFDRVYFLTRCTHTSIKLKLLYLTHLKVESERKEQHRGAYFSYIHSRNISRRGIATFFLGITNSIFIENELQIP